MWNGECSETKLSGVCGASGVNLKWGGQGIIVTVRPGIDLFLDFSYLFERFYSKSLLYSVSFFHALTAPLSTLLIAFSRTLSSLPSPPFPCPAHAHTRTRTHPRAHTTVPISLYVSMELVKVAQGVLIDSDVDMYHADTNTPAQVNNSHTHIYIPLYIFLFSLAHSYYIVIYEYVSLTLPCTAHTIISSA